MKPVSTSLILITLLVELGVAAAVSSSLARSKTFRNLLLTTHRTIRQTAQLVTIFSVPLILGVWIRVRVPNFLAADISFEATILLGVLVGPLAATVGGAALAVPALLHGEFWALPVNVAIAAVAGSYKRFAESEDVWSFSPLIDLSIYRWITRNLKRPHLDRQILLLMLITAMEFCTSELSRFYPQRFFELHSSSWLVELAICFCAPVVVGIPLKIWNQIRIERKLEEQSRLLLEARLDALQRQINPHFLFNTLNSITSLVRSQPELAREMIVKLANILRILLKDREAFVPFAEELAFTDDYLDIEVVRFGEKLRVVKEIAPDTLGVVVPSMLLQPLLENSIKHGLEPRIEGGTVTLRSRITDDGRLLVEVEDDGVGMAPERRVAGELRTSGTGIGMRNVKERMEVLYGTSAHVEIESRPGRGTKVSLLMPVLEGGAGGWEMVREAVGNALKGIGR
ncbi:sensor histidine kinase [Granulicella tundricola]|uniref:histidine kinase n=1 Tax=Granulicella tundricola (strain ATCC BAA-1859 / DSM 23138 / MP5ACTX9) TaxID=1198114 RepID=E8X4I1_GRATM|nr:histidine kinase [Granulicella tundricola]ADW69391.1 signal transduction histidine kinase, LytS [Granulicella tundricola MP5ACTX9]